MLQVLLNGLAEVCEVCVAPHSEPLLDGAVASSVKCSKCEWYGSSLPFKLLVSPARSKVSTCWMLLPRSDLLLLGCIWVETMELVLEWKLKAAG